MRKLINLWILFFIIGLISCDEEIKDEIIFQPTEHNICKLGSKMRFVINIPEGTYNFSSLDALLTCEGYFCRDFLAPVSEMNELAKNLSDTTIFHWEVMTSVSPYPKNDCILLIYGEEYEDKFMCSLGSSNFAIDVIRDLSKSLSGDSLSAFNEIISYLSN